MADIHTREQRSRNMAAIRSKNTKPELRVRSLLHSLGYRFRLHRSDLPGRPDIVLPKFRTAILVHGCFWHSHDCRRGSLVPETRGQYWADKRRRTAERDLQAVQSLNAFGWKVIVVWECLSDAELREFLISMLPPLTARFRHISSLPETTAAPPVDLSR